MSSLYNKTLKEVILESSSGSPVPGGGSVSAITASLGLAMAIMVCNLTLGREKYAAVQPQIKINFYKAKDMMERLEELAEADMVEFTSFMVAHRLPRGTAEENATRLAAIQEALIRATDVPMDIAETCLESLEIILRIAAIGNKMAVSDAGVSAIILEAALNAVLLNVDSNLPLIENEAYRSNIMERKENVLEKAKHLKDEIILLVKERMKI